MNIVFKSPGTLFGFAKDLLKERKFVLDVVTFSSPFYTDS